jgi:aspartate/methionine/tyrosine aminotransferase
MDIKKLMNKQFGALEGGLFSTVSKADVGDGVSRLREKGIDILAWADPFFPDPSIPSSVQKSMIDAIESGFPSHYSLPIGDELLRKQIARKIADTTGLSIDPSRNIIVTPGSDSGLLYAMMPFIESGDEVMIPDPSYPSNFLNPKLLGGVTVPVPLNAEKGYAIDIKAFEARLTQRTKMVVLTHPNNPTTTVFSRDQLNSLAQFIIGNNLILVCDQAFEDHIFDNREFVSPATLEGMWERTVTVCSISKGLGLSGFRIGYIYANDHIMDVLYGGAVNVLGASATITSIGALQALKENEYLACLNARHERRRKLAYEKFSKLKGVKMHLSESGILSWLDVSELGSSEEVVAYLLEHANVLVNAGSAYGTQGAGHIRVVTGCFAEDSKAEEVFTRMAKALEQLAEAKHIR